MTSLESLRQQLNDLLILNHGDIKITEYPNLVSDAKELGYNSGQLSQLIQQLYSEIDWKPFELINNKLEIIFRKGIITTEQFEEIVLLVSDKVSRNIVGEYVVSEISKREFKPRETNQPDPLSIQNKWMTDQVWVEYKESLIEVEWLGKQANSLAKLGEISFQNKEDAKYFLRNGNYLPGLITALTKSASKADQFARIIEDESDSEKKYLRIIYKLNPHLPFQFQDKLYTNLSGLLHDACSTSQLYYALLDSYRKGELQIWERELDSTLALNISDNYDLNGFLKFLYKTDSTLPFYINNNRYATPEELADHAKKDFTIWPDIAHSIAEKNINEWFTGLGNDDWNNQIENSHHFISQSGYYTEPEINLGLVQALFYIIDPISGRPKLEINQEKVQLLSINGGVTLNHSINLRLKNQGYIKVKVYFKFAKEGIFLSNDVFELNTLEGKTSANFDIIIDTTSLQKEKLYNLELVISSVYEDIIIPVEIKVVFPKKAYILKLIQYGLITACFFGAIRYILGILLDYNGWLVDTQQGINSSDIINNSPLLSFFIFVLFISGCIFSFKLVKKFEKV